MTPTTQTEYPPSTTVYPSDPSAATSSATPNDYGYGYANPGGTTPPAALSASDQYTSLSSTSTAVPVAHLEISTPSQAAIIAISVICGLLLLALLFAILVIIGKRYEQLHIDIDGGSGGGGHHRRKRHRSEKAYTDYGDIGRLRGFDLGGIGRQRGLPGMDPAFLRAEPAPHLQGNAGVPPDYFPNPRMPNLGRAQAQQEREDIQEAEELSEVSNTRAGGTRTSRSGSESCHHSSEVSSSHPRGRHGGK